MRNSICFLLVLCLGFSAAEGPSESQKLSDGEIIAGLASYRNSIIRQDEKAYIQTVASVRELQTFGLNEKDLVALYKAVFSYLYQKTDIPNHLIKQFSKYRNHKGEELSAEGLEHHLNALAQNFDLLDGILQGLFEVLPPFKLDPNASLFREIKFYQFEKESHIANIGGGIGTFSLMLAHCLPKSSFVLTELDLNDLRILRARKKSFAKLIDSTRIDIRKGQIQSTGLEPASLDRVILRRTLHHFASPTAMLRDIYRVLTPDGEVCLQEPDGRINIRKLFVEICSDAMKPHEVRELMHTHGFIENDQLKMGHYIYANYRKKAT